MLINVQNVHTEWRTDKFQLQDTIWPTQVVAMARVERTEPRRFSFRSITEAMPTPSSKTSMKIERVWSSESGHNVSIRVREGFKAKRKLQNATEDYG
jgi:hypothetical protein